MEEKKPVEPVPASTILMLRDANEGLQVFMVVRHHRIDFASGALVFPGGKVDDGDTLVRDRCDGQEELSDAELAFRAAAIREAFEECGILLARQNGQRELITGSKLEALDSYRKQLNDNEVSLLAFLEAEDLRLACDLLQDYSHWITPAMMPKRFDTHFYLAVAPEDHLAVHDGHESVDSVWITPARALQEAKDGSRTIIFPTRLNIEKLGESASVAAALEDAKERHRVTVLPWTEQRDDGPYLCIPPEAGYSISEEKMDGSPA